MSTETARELAGVREAVAEEVGQRLLATAGLLDARHHLDFLRASVDDGDLTSFATYAAWARDLLRSSGTAPEVLVEDLEVIRAELAHRLSPVAARAVDAALRSGIDAVTQSPHLHTADGEALTPGAELYLAAAVRGRRSDALTVVRAALGAGVPLTEVYVDVVQRALHDVGRRWQRNELTVAEEHLATATTQLVLSVLHETAIDTAPSRRGTAVVTGVAGERHVVGATIVADVLEADGWDVCFLSTDVPAADVVATVEHHRADLVAISVTMRGCVPEAEDLVARLRRLGTSAPRIIVGGAPFRADPDLWRAIGADGSAADVRGVTDLARG